MPDTSEERNICCLVGGYIMHTGTTWWAIKKGHSLPKHVTGF